jgi:hypothetical protein
LTVLKRQGNIQRRNIPLVKGDQFMHGFLRTYADTDIQVPADANDLAIDRREAT